MRKHPLTHKKVLELINNHRPSDYVYRCMQAAYDLGRNEQLVEAIKWLDENIANYHYRHYYDTGEYPRPTRRWDKLTEHLKETMRPQEEDS